MSTKMTEAKLNEEEIEALLAIYDRKHIGIPKVMLNRLAERELIAFRFPRGWALSGKGRIYLAKQKKIE